jgi:hypothetical protein
MSRSDDESKSSQEILNNLIRKAVGAYVAAEDTVSKTISVAQAPKEVFREALESFFENYIVNVKAEISFSPKTSKKGE